jgi:hypothetical protein
MSCSPFLPPLPASISKVKLARHSPCCTQRCRRLDRKQLDASVQQHFYEDGEENVMSQKRGHRLVRIDFI